MFNSNYLFNPWTTWKIKIYLVKKLTLRKLELHRYNITSSSSSQAHPTYEIIWNADAAREKNLHIKTDGWVKK